MVLLIQVIEALKILEFKQKEEEIGSQMKVYVNGMDSIIRLLVQSL